MITGNISDSNVSCSVIILGVSGSSSIFSGTRGNSLVTGTVLHAVKVVNDKVVNDKMIKNDLTIDIMNVKLAHIYL